MTTLRVEQQINSKFFIRLKISAAECLNVLTKVCVKDTMAI